MKKLFLLFTVVILLFSLSSCNKKDLSGLKDHDTLVVGMECSYAPFNWTEQRHTVLNVPIENVKGAYADGYDVQIAKKLAEGLGVKLKVFSFTWSGLIPALNNGQIDAIIAGMSPTEERKEAIDFTEGYYTSSHVILINKDSKFKDAKTLSDFKGAKIAGQKGTLYADLVPQMVLKGAIAGTDLDNVPALVASIHNGVIDGTIVEEPVAKGIVAGDSSLTYIKTTDKFDVKKEDVMVSIGVRKNSTITEKLNAILNTIDETERNNIMTEAVRKNSLNEELPEVLPDTETKVTTSSTAEKLLTPLTWVLDHTIYYLYWAIGKVISLILPNSFTLVFEEFSNLFWSGIVKTIYLALFGTLFGLLIACFLGVIRTIKVNKNDNIFLKGLKYLSNGLIKVYVTIFRGTPMIVQSMIIYYSLYKLIGWDPFDAAMLTVTINTGAYLTEVIKSSILNLDKGQMEAARALGFSYTRSLFLIVFPQALKNAMASIGNEFVINIKDTSVLNVIGCAEMYYVLNTVAGKNYFYLETMISGALIYLILTYTATKLLALVEKHLGAPTKELTSSN